MADLYSEHTTVQTLVPAARTANGNGTTVDRGQNGDDFASAMFVVTAGTITDGTHTIVVEHSDNDAAWSAVAAGDLQGVPPAILAADDNKRFEVGYQGKKRFLRANVTVAGATTGGVYGVLVLLGRPRVAPVTRL